MNLKSTLKKIEKAGEEKTRLEEQLKMLKEQQSEIETELADLGLSDVNEIDGEIEKMEKKLNGCMKELDDIMSESEPDEGDDDSEEISLESLGL